tara:strand:- start:1283 stop:2746 length:1464 start_codon:yes stop_codon:yes gene_type:complete
MTDGDFDASDFADFDSNDFGSDYTAPKPDKPERPGPSLPFSVDGVDLQTPPGFVGEIADWIDGQCRYKRRNLSVATAIVSVGNIGGLRHVDARDGVTANMMAFCVAASATGKEAVQQAMAELHRAAGLGGAMQGAIKSEQEIMRNLIEHQPAFYLVDEVGILLGKIRNAQKKGGAAYLEGVFGSIMSAYSKASTHLLLGGDIKRELRKIYGSALARAKDDGDAPTIARAERMLGMIDNGLERPFLSLVGFTTPSTFDGIMDGETATQGFVGRSIIVTEKDINPEARAGFKRLPLSDGLQHQLAALYNGGTFDVMQRGSARIEHYGDMTDVETAPDADQMLLDVATWLHGYADDMGEHTGEASVAMIRRSYEMIAKISFILGIPGGVRTADHVRWAFAYVKHEIDAKIALVFANDNAKDRPEESIAARLMSFIDPEKGCTIAVLANRIRMKPAAILPILQKMKASGMVDEVTKGRKWKGKPVTVWVPV